MLSHFRWWRRWRRGCWYQVTGFMWGVRWVRRLYPEPRVQYGEPTRHPDGLAIDETPCEDHRSPDELARWMLGEKYQRPIWKDVVEQMLTDALAQAARIMTLLMVDRRAEQHKSGLFGPCECVHCSRRKRER